MGATDVPAWPATLMTRRHAPPSSAMLCPCRDTLPENGLPGSTTNWRPRPNPLDPAALNSHVVDEDRDRTKRIQGQSKHKFDAWWVNDIVLNRDRTTAGRVDALRECIDLCRRSCGDRNCGALIGKCLGDRSAKPSTRPRRECEISGEPPSAGGRNSSRMGAANRPRFARTGRTVTQEIAHCNSLA